MPWLNIIDQQMIGTLGGVAANNHIPVKTDGGEGVFHLDPSVRYVIADASENTVIITLPDPTITLGCDLVIKVKKAINQVEIIPYKGECIDNATGPIKLDVDNSYVRLVSDGVDWYIIG